ncbi:MAG: DUF1573 domain-containing protein [Saprospirales bacterium]|nr:MAG: DUF1573 domain-containing protein [Saprospirales bacterium]
MTYFKTIIFLLGLLFLVGCQNEQETSVGETSPETTTATDAAAAADQMTASQNQADNVTSTRPEAPRGGTTTIAFESDIADFGTIQDGEKVRHTFTFTNTGDEPLVISNARGSCGCTVPDWERNPVLPGDTGSLTVEYDSTNKGGVGGKVDTKFVTVTANTTPATHRLTVRANVVKPDA